VQLELLIKGMQEATHQGQRGNTLLLVAVALVALEYLQLTLQQVVEMVEQE